MAERELSTLLEGGAFFEGPRWRDGRWWVSDFYRGTVSTVTPDGDEEIVLEVPEQPSGLGWMPDGSLLVVSRKDFRVLRRTPGGEVTEHADLSGMAAGHLNDMVVDALRARLRRQLRLRPDGGRRPVLDRPDPDRPRRRRDRSRRATCGSPTAR